MQRQKSDAGRCPDLKRLPGGVQPPGLRIDAELDQRVGRLVRHDQPGTARVDAKVPRCLSLSRNEFNQSKRARFGID